jgi:hypothetical protein
MDRAFTIEVLIEEKETLWAVDGEHYCRFSHRNPSPFAATWVQVAGVRDGTLKVDKVDIYPVLAAPLVEVRSPWNYLWNIYTYELRINKLWNSTSEQIPYEKYHYFEIT